MSAPIFDDALFGNSTQFDVQTPLAPPRDIPLYASNAAKSLTAVGSAQTFIAVDSTDQSFTASES